MAIGHVMIEYLIRYRIVTNHAVFRLSPCKIYATIDGNAIEPTVKLRGPLEILKASICFEKNILCEIEHIFRIGNDTANDPVNAIAVAQI